MNLADAPDVLTVEEAAKLLRIGRGAAYEAARRGDLPTVRIGARTLRVPRHRLEALLGAESDDGSADSPINDERRVQQPGVVQGSRRQARHDKE